MEAYVWKCDICLTSKTIRHKFYDDLESLLVSIYYWKNLSIDFLTGLLLLTNWKLDSYDAIFVIVNRLTKIVHYKLVKTTIDIACQKNVIIDVIIRHYSLFKSIFSN